jgi:hypothetical protein
VNRTKAEIYKIGGLAVKIRVRNLAKTIWKKVTIIKYLTFSTRCPIFKDTANIEGYD